ncbi:MAG: hypothetical protein KIT83_14065 [Bryobacterales bacterium]|nr:hypothetical protein [Bryobacterales bacterium]
MTSFKGIEGAPHVMNLASKYTRTELIEDGDIQKWRGANRTTGAGVVMYMYTGGFDSRQLPSQYPSSEIEQRLAEGHFRVESGVYGLSPCVICSEQPVITASKPEVLPVAVVTPITGHATPETAAEAEMGEFTALFGAAMDAPAPTPPAPSPAPAQPAPVAAAPIPEPPAPVPPPEPEIPMVGPGGGTFTQMYLAADPSRMGWVGSSNLNRPTPEPKSTQAEQTPSQPEPVASPAPERGAFTELYMAVDPAAIESPGVASPAVPAAPRPQQEKVRGTFTEMYMALDPKTLEEPATQPAQVADPEPAATSAAPAPGTFTELYMALDPSVAPPPPVAGAPAAPTPAVAAPSESKPSEAPGEFTRMFQPEEFASASAAEPEPEVTMTAAPFIEEPAELQETASFMLPPETPALPPMPPASGTKTDGEPGEFTLMFQTGLDSTGEEGESQSRAVEAEAPSPSEEAKPKSPVSSGSYSRTYVSTDEMPVMVEPLDGPPSAQPPAAPPATPPSAPPAAPPALAAREDVGEFTQLFASPSDADVTAPFFVPTAAQTPAPASPAAPATPPASAPLPVVEPKKPAAAASSEPGEFTKFFQPGELESVRQEVLAKKAESAVSAAPAAPAAPKEAPGEFTMMFSAADLAQNPPAEAPAAPGAAKQPPVFDAPPSAGEFTQMFRSADAGLMPPSEPAASESPMGGGFGDAMMPPPSSPGSGSPFGEPAGSAPAGGPTFTEYFRAADASSDFGAPPSQPSDDLASGSDGPTRMPESTPSPFESSAPKEDVPSYGAGFGGGGATQFFQMPASEASPQAPMGPVESVGPGEYTRMISGEDLRLAMEQGPGGAPGGGAAATPGAPGGAAGGGMSVPGVTGPRVSGPYVQGPNISASGVSAPHISAPTVQGPYMATPQVHAPHMSAPHMSGPSMSGSGMTGPSMSGPHVSGPSMSGAGMSSAPMHMPLMGGAPPAAPAAGAPVPMGNAPTAGGSSASKIIIFVTIIVTVIAVALVLMVAYFALRG